MTDPELRSLILELIADIAPEADVSTARDDYDLRESFDLDSMDFANLVSAIHQQLKINIPESDYNKLFKLESGVAYLQDALKKAGSQT
jgi:acyl carrier protein